MDAAIYNQLDDSDVPWLSHLERVAWSAGDTEHAAQLGALIKALEELAAEPERIEAAEQAAFEAGKAEGIESGQGDVREQCEEILGELLDLTRTKRANRRHELVTKLVEILL